MHTPLTSLSLVGMPGLWEWIIIGLAIAIFFGAAKLPKLGKGLGEGIRNFKKGLKGKEGKNGLPEKAEQDEEADKEAPEKEKE